MRQKDKLSQKKNRNRDTHKTTITANEQDSSCKMYGSSCSSSHQGDKLFPLLCVRKLNRLPSLIPSLHSWYLEGSSEYVAQVWSGKKNHMICSFIYIDSSRQFQIFLFQILYWCATCSELPSNISSMIQHTMMFPWFLTKIPF